MGRLSNADLEAVLAFAADIAACGLEDAHAPDVVARVQALVRCEDITYQDCDLHERKFVASVGACAEEDGADDDWLYWALGPCPISDHRVRTGDLEVVTMSDLMDRRHYHALGIFQDYFRPAGLEYIIDLGLPAGPHRHRSFVLFREPGSGDFSGRDRAVLEALRPFLLVLEAQAALRRRLTQALAAREDDVDALESAGLTAREREIVGLVAQGRTNSQIAAELWVAPSTVKKHLENVYAKLGVGRRAAAAGLTRQVRQPVDH